MCVFYMQGFFRNVLKRIQGASGKPDFNAADKRTLPLKDVEDDSIPRYPPFAKGLPVAPVDRVLETQAELIERIRMALGFSLPDFEKLLLPVLRNYAAFVHLLPASETHHHRGAGGLFRHGLEAAFGAAQASDGVVFSIVGTPKEKRDNEPRWRLVSTLAGLLHDVGKPFSDMTVTNAEGTAIWNPHSEPLFEWASKHGVDRYFLRWRDSRQKRHESFALLAVDRMIPVKTREFIAHPVPEIMGALLEAISGTRIDNPVTKLMMFADKESVQRDLKQSRLDVDEFSYGVPVERYVFDAIRRLVNTGKWKVNEPGAKVWHLHDGVFVAWRSLGDMYALIGKDKIPGIPKDPDTLADILIERGFALQNKVTEGDSEATYRYWEVQPEGIPAKILMLRFDSHELIFTNEPPAPVAAVITGAAKDNSNADLTGTLPASVDNSNSDDKGDHSTDSPEDQTPEQDDDGGLSESSAEAILAASNEVDELFGDVGIAGVLGMLSASSEVDGESEKGSDDEVTATHTDSAADSPLEEHAQTELTEDKQEPAPTVAPAIPAPDKKPSKASEEVISPAETPKVSHVQLLRATFEAENKAGKTDTDTVSVVNPVSSAEKPLDSPKPSTETPVQAESLIPLLAKFASAGPLLEKILLPAVNDPELIGERVRIIRGQVVIPFPSGLKDLGKRAAVLNILSDDGALERNQIMPGRNVQEVGGVKCLILDASIGAAFKKATGHHEATGQIEVSKSKKSKARPRTEPVTRKVKSGLKTLGFLTGSKGEAGATEDQKNTTQNRTVFKPPQRPKKTVPEEQTKPAKKVVLDDEVDKKLHREQVVMQVEDDDVYESSENQISTILASLKRMIIEGDGRWIVSPVITNPNGSLSTSSQAIDQLILEHPTLIKPILRRQLMDVGIFTEGDTITLSKDRINT